MVLVLGCLGSFWYSLFMMPSFSKISKCGLRPEYEPPVM